MNKYMDLKTNWSIFSKNRSSIYGVAIISIIIYHYFEDVAALNLTGGGSARYANYITLLLVVLELNFLYFCPGLDFIFRWKKIQILCTFLPKEQREFYQRI